MLGQLRTRIVLGAVAVAVVGAGVWYFVIRDDAPAPVSLETAVSSVEDATATPTAPPAAATSTPEPTATAEATATEAPASPPEPTPTPTPTPPPTEEPAPTWPDDPTGEWVVSEAGETFVGYRVNEELASVGAFTAVGRTSAVTGSLVFDGAAITAVEIEADVTRLSSGDSRRDNALRSQGLETGTYPTASFSLTQPIALDAVPAEGDSIAVDAVGELTIHGVTNEVTIPLEGQRTGGYVVVVGSLEITFADYGMETPRAFIVVSIEDFGVMEFQLVFEPA
ncbi:MAG: YceI family protein [Chloroflexi bacterium]|nr:YceI family protein [Chloroflexota bacterium]